MTLLIKNVKYLVTCDDDNRVLKEVNVFVEDGIIKSIGADVQTADDVIDGSHMVMYPGLINTHHHLYQTFSRNLPEVQNMELFPWLKTLRNLEEFKSGYRLLQLFNRNGRTFKNRMYLLSGPPLRISGRHRHGPSGFPVCCRRRPRHAFPRNPGQHGLKCQGRRASA